jgi:hypothetical protein
MWGERPYRASGRLLNTYDSGNGHAFNAATAASWHVREQGLAYPDKPGADQCLPNRNEAIYRLQVFGSLLAN